MSVFLRLVLLASCAWNSVVAQDTVAPTSAPTATAWGGCVDKQNPGAKVEIGKATTVCLVLGDGTDWSAERTYLRLNFKPKADQYSRFHVPQSFQQLVVDTRGRVSDLFAGKNITVHVESQQALSFQKRYYDSFNKIFPHLTAVIDVNKGVVEGIAWDDACLFCSKNECEENTFDFNGFRGNTKQFNQPTGGCFVEKPVCLQFNSEERTDCDLLLYVVWTGTDKNGESLLSSAYRFSAFPAQELSDRFSQNLPDFSADST